MRPRSSGSSATDDTNIIFGATIDERLNGQVWVTVIATGIGGTPPCCLLPSFSSATGASAGPRPSSVATRATCQSFLR